MNGGGVDVCCRVGDFGEGTTAATGSFERAGVGEASCWVCAEGTVKRVCWVDVLYNEDS
jgi:hypothetical protein